jgi:hypothetical protein
MMARHDRDQRQPFYEFSVDEIVPPGHPLRRINVVATGVPADLHEQRRPFCGDISRPSIDHEVMIRTGLCRLDRCPPEPSGISLHERRPVDRS